MAGAPASVGSMMFTPDGGTSIVGATDQFLRFDASSGTPLPPVMVPGSDGHGTLSAMARCSRRTGSRVKTLRYPDGTPTMSPVIAQVAGAIALSRRLRFSRCRR